MSSSGALCDKFIEEEGDQILMALFREELYAVGNCNMPAFDATFEQTVCTLPQRQSVS